MNWRKLKKMWIADLGDGTYRNPILYTDYSDPDAVRVGDDFFMIASSFSNVPSVPILHSKDLVNWKVINYVMERLPFERFDTPQYGCGAWAPSIRYHEGLYYVFIPFVDEGIAVCTTEDPWGKWSEPHFIKQNAGWIDPCPFWDDDGTMYMVNGFAKSRIGFKSALYISPVRDEGKGLEAFPDEGGFVYDGHATQPTIEGPKLYKRNGYYYIFAPAGGVKTGWQTVLRSKKILGPYEEKIVLHQGNTAVNGPHQGAWVDTQCGQDWFIHFQDVGSAGRIVHLQPMRWVDDWPVIGINEDENGCGEPVIVYEKPDVGDEFMIEAPDDTDFFEEYDDEERIYGLQWQWNANPDEDWCTWGNDGLKMLPQKVEPGQLISSLGNLLLQKWPAPEFMITVLIHMEEMWEGDAVGVLSLGKYCDTLLVCKRKDVWIVKQKIEKKEKTWTEVSCTELETVDWESIFIRMKVRNAETVSWEISPDGEDFHAVGQETKAEAMPGGWVGVKVGLVSIHEGENKTVPEDEWEYPCAKVDYFMFQPYK